MKYDLFISYSRKDFEEVSVLIEKIKAALPGLSYWFDIDGIESGDEFEDKIISAINDSSYLLFALSDNSLGSQWTKDEVMYAKNKGKKIIPVLLNGARMTDWFLFKFGRVDCIDSANRLQMDKLLHNLATWTGKSISEHQPVPPAEKEPSQNVRPEVLCPCGSGRLFKDCHGREVEPVEKTWKVGDYYNVDGKEGVVFWVDETGRHGRIVSLDQTELQWSTRKQFKVDVSDKQDGMRNLEIVMKIGDWRKKFPAFAWCADHGDDWYLPACEELSLLLNSRTVRAKVNRTLKASCADTLRVKSGFGGYYNDLLGAVMTDNVYYWSSTKSTYGQVETIRMPDFYIWPWDRTCHHYVRTVSTF